MQGLHDAKIIGSFQLMALPLLLAYVNNSSLWSFNVCKKLRLIIVISSCEILRKCLPLKRQDMKNNGEILVGVQTFFSGFCGRFFEVVLSMIIVLRFCCHTLPILYSCVGYLWTMETKKDKIAV